VPVCEALVGDEELQRRLVCMGEAPTALALRIVGHAHQAWNDAGLSFHARNARLQLHWILLRQCMLPELDSASASAVVAGRNSRVMGFTRELLLVMMANIEARMQLLAAVPGACLTLVERSLSTDDLEGEFAQLVLGVKYKPSPQMAAGFLRRLDFLRRRGQAEHGLAMPKSSKSLYSYHDATASADVRWNNGQLLVDEAARQAALERLERRSRNAQGLTRAAAVRSYHSVG
jgi:hypothetical protein